MKWTNAYYAAALLAMTEPAAADGMYLGGKLGLMDPDVSHASEATNLGVLLGYDFPTPGILVPAVEVELTTTVSDGDLGHWGHWDIDTQAAYGVLKIGDALYAKIKGGLRHEEVSVSRHGASFDGDDTGLSIGFGGGWRIAPNLSLEAEFTRIEQDVDYWSLGANYHF